MAKYVVLGTFTEQGIKNARETVERGQKFREMVDHMGGSVDVLLWTMGQFDIVAVIDAPDDETASAIVLKVSGLGNVRGTTLRAFDADDVGGILARLG